MICEYHDYRLFKMLIHRICHAIRFEHDNSFLRYMAAPISLNLSANKLRSDLAKWVCEDAKQGQDYVINEKGDRMYYKERISGFVSPLLKTMGLEVGYAILSMEEHTDRSSGLGIYHVAIFDYTINRAEPRR